MDTEKCPKCKDEKQYCMCLPEGLTCDVCGMFYFCKGIGTIRSEKQNRCDWHPVRFKISVTAYIEQKERADRYEKRLQIDPQGSDKIDELEQALEFAKHRADIATEKGIKLCAEVFRLGCENIENKQKAERFWQALNCDCQLYFKTRPRVIDCKHNTPINYIAVGKRDSCPKCGDIRKEAREALNLLQKSKEE